MDHSTQYIPADFTDTQDIVWELCKTGKHDSLMLPYRGRNTKVTSFPPKLCRKFFKSVIKRPLKKWHRYILVPPSLFLCLQHHCVFSPPSHVGGQSPGWGWLQAEAKEADPESRRLPEGTWLPALPFQEGKQTSSSSSVATQRAQLQPCLKSLLLSQPPRSWSQCMPCL